VDEWSVPFLLEKPEFFSHAGADKTRVLTNSLVASVPSYSRADDRRRSQIEEDLAEKAERDVAPEYRRQWNLATDTNFLQGVTYMAELNPEEPAVFVMAGIAAFRNRDFNLGVAAFERAVALKSPQADLLQWKIADAKEFIEKSEMHPTLRGVVTGLIVLGMCGVGGVVAIILGVRWIRRRVRSTPSA
jgi:hypothetical protein